MAKTASHTGGPKWTAEHRYGDVFECSNGKISLSHSKLGLEAAKANLEANGSDSASRARAEKPRPAASPFVR